MYTKTAARIAQGIPANPPSTDFIDSTCVVTLLTSGSAGVNQNLLLQGSPVCIDITNLVTANTTTPVIEQCVLPQNTSSAGALFGVYQGATITNANTSNTTTIAVTVRKLGYGVVLAGGVTTSVTVGGVVSILPGSTPGYASQLIPSIAVTQQASVYYVGNVVATGAKTTIGAVAVTASTTTQAVVNAYINVLCQGV